MPRRGKKVLRSEPLILLDDVDFTYDHGGSLILTDINLRVTSGTVTALVGASGSGKSTLLRLIGGLISPTAGSAIRQKRTRMVFQNSALLPWLTVYDNVAFGMSKAHMVGKKPGFIVSKALTTVGVHHLKDMYPRDISGGERQRVGIARALISEPELLLLDEPFSALDVDITTELTSLIETQCIKKHMTVIMVSHSIENAVTLADRVLVCSKGRITEDIAVPFPHPRGEYTDALRAIAKQISLT
jgi:ABC-type nitrate/sulfonate/bicarbonate transport system ATPase subunit